MHVGPEMFKMMRNGNLLDAVESLIGGELYSNPIQNVRIKPPESCLSKASNANHQGLNWSLSAATPWHQDHAICTADAERTEFVTCWIPLHKIPLDNSPLLVVPRSHKCGLVDHCVSKKTKEIHLPAVNLEDSKKRVSREAIALPMERGDVLFLHKHTMHASAPNKSDRMRFSVDLRYNVTGHPTGRGKFPGFVARSKIDSTRELKDHKVWAKLWTDTRAKFADAAIQQKKSASDYAEEGKTPVKEEIPYGRERWVNHPDAIPCA
mmetsp:Transcript_24505/g.45832  ORF Transcript_24505/g.45832 Transcript_24505/m.45832 type:complete len:265 (-) Transcript_24505:259-1053(-)